ncbi:MAG: transcription antitermination factor NusB [Desulfohalobiaceae bacterium]|nr:transcription antitermination factor NusB [Desulfohalobiaceae bacterium]
MSKSKKSPRRQGRERAFQVLFGCNFSPATQKECVRRTFQNFVKVRDSGSRSKLVNSFAWGIISGVVDNMEDLDEVIMGFSENWRLDRIARIELTILRLSLFEMLYRPDIPVKVGINEGIELSKKFGDEKSSRFVNGILDAAAEKIRTGELHPREDDGHSAEPVGAD